MYPSRTRAPCGRRSFPGQSLEVVNVVPTDGEDSGSRADRCEGRADGDDGSFTEYALAPGSSPQRIAVGSDGALWFTELGVNKVGQLTTAGTLTEYPVPGGPVGITATPTDEALYVVLFNASAVARLALDGTVTNEWATPSPNSAPLQITAGSGHELWFSESSLSPTGNKIGRLDPYNH